MITVKTAPQLSLAQPQERERTRQERKKNGTDDVAKTRASWSKMTKMTNITDTVTDCDMCSLLKRNKETKEKPTTPQWQSLGPKDL